MLRCMASGLVAALFALTPAAAHELVGANLNGIADFSRNQEYVDLMRQARAFGSFSDPFNTVIPVGADGWPSGDFGVTLLGGGQANVAGIGGTYKVIFSGRATVTSAAAGTVANQTYDPATNLSRADVVFPADGEALALRFAVVPGAATNAVKNLRVIRPGFDADNPPTYTTAWLAHVSRFRVLRFMDWLVTNHEANAIVTWEDRPTLQKKRSEAGGARWEAIVELANTVSRDIWINIPVRANDDYVRNLATLLRDTLNPQINVYIEYSNELWNGAFDQFAIQRDLAVAEASNPGSPLRFDGSTDTSRWAFRRVGKRSKEISDIFRSVWGAAAINTRIRMVLAGQMANPFIVTEGLELVDTGMNTRPATVFYAISGAPYLFPSATNDAQADEAPGFGVEQIIAGLQAAASSAPGTYQYETHAALGAWYGLKVLAYEGGFDTFGSQNIAAKRQANLDPRIRAICRTLLDGWHAAGFDPFLWFNAGADNYAIPFGQWPLLEDIRAPAKPKNQCMDDVLAAARPGLTMGNSIAAAIPAGAYIGSTASASPLTNASAPFGFPGYVEYLLRADATGSYRLTFSAQGSSVPKIDVRLNGAVIDASFALPEGSAFADSQSLTVTLRQGINALRIHRPAAAGSWTIQSFTVRAGGVAQPAANHTSLWFNPAESGWGLNLNHQGNLLFATLFTYAADGRDLWLVASGLEAQADGSFTGPLFRTSGPAFNASPWTAVTVAPVGSMTLRFPTASTGTLQYTFNGTNVSKAIERQVFSAPVPTCIAQAGSRVAESNFQDLWFNPAESGWGLNLTHQGSLVFATLFTYAADGRDLWLVASGLERQPDGRYTGPLFRTHGPAFNAQPWTGVTVETVGSMSLAFSDGQTGSLAYTFNGVSVTKPITRQVFAATVPVCR
jgi:hypothetical protein